MSKLVDMFFDIVKENILLCSIVVVTYVVLTIVSLAFIFKKIHESPWKAFIPFYNVLFLLELLEIPVWMGILLFVPFVNVIGFFLLTFLIGWKLGTYCQKGIIMKLGLMFLPFIFYPSLAYGDINLGANIIDLGQPEEEFHLEAVKVKGIKITSPYTLNPTTLAKIAPVRKRTISIPKKDVKLKNPDMVAVLGSNNEVEDLSVALPTADDLTFDYDSLYDQSGNASHHEATSLKDLVEEESLELPKETKEEEKKEKVKVEEEKEVLPVIHDVALEEAEPVQEMGIISINKRDDYRYNHLVEEEKKEEVKIPSPVPIGAPVEEGPLEKKEEVEDMTPFDPYLAKTADPMVAAAPDMNFEDIVPEEIEVPGITEQEKTVPEISLDEVENIGVIEPEALPVSVFNRPDVTPQAKTATDEETVMPSIVAEAVIGEKEKSINDLPIMEEDDFNKYANEKKEMTKEEAMGLHKQEQEEQPLSGATPQPVAGPNYIPYPAYMPTDPNMQPYPYPQMVYGPMPMYPQMPYMMPTYGNVAYPAPGGVPNYSQAMTPASYPLPDKMPETSVPEAVPEIKKCPVCGADIIHEKVCPICGYKL